MAEGGGSGSGGGGPPGKEYRVKMAKVEGNKKYHVMRFKPPHKCDLEKLVKPTLDRQQVHTEEEAAPEYGEGSEYGKLRRDEARRRKRGQRMKRADPDDQPWVLKEQKRGGKHFIGRKEGTIMSGSSYFMLMLGEDEAFEAYPIGSWYDFVPPVKYNYLDADEAEERFERRSKTLNLFSVMLSKKLKGQGEEGEEEEGGGDMGEGGKARGKRSKKIAASQLGLVLTDSEQEDSSSADSEDSSAPNPKKGSKRKRGQRPSTSEVAGEDTDEGETESREVDYMSDSTSASEEEFREKEALKNAPEDDTVAERKEEVEIDKGFTDSSSSSEDELTEEGKEIQALLSRDKVSGGEEEEEGEQEESVKAEAAEVVVAKAEASPVKIKTKPAKDSPSKKSKGHKRERAKGKEAGVAPDPSKPSSSGATSSDVSPPAKKARVESPSTITEEEVKRYLSRRPITSKDIVKKFVSKKSGMERNVIVEVLGKIIQNMRGVEKQTHMGKLYLSLKSEEQQQ